MSVTGLRDILSALSEPYAIIILEIIHRHKVSKLTDIMLELKSLSKYKSIRSTIERLIHAQLITREIVKKGAVKKWYLRLTEKGKKIIEGLKEILNEL